MRIDGRERWMSGQEAIVGALRDRAITGDLRAAGKMLELRAEALAQAERVRARTPESDAIGRMVVMLAGLMRTVKSGGGEGVQADEEAIRRNAEAMHELAPISRASGTGDQEVGQGRSPSGAEVEGGPEGDAPDAQNHDCCVPGEDGRADAVPPKGVPERSRSASSPPGESDPVAEAPRKAADNSTREIADLPEAMSARRRGDPLISAAQPLTADGYGLGGGSSRLPGPGTFT